MHAAGLEPSPAVTVDDKLSTTWIVENLRARPLQGAASLELPEGLGVNDNNFSFADTTISKPARKEINLTLAPEAQAYAGHIALETQLFNEHVPIAVIRLGTRNKVSISEEVSEGHTLMAVDNGRYRFTVSPDFAGSVTAWCEGEVNHLLSAFPKQRTFNWLSPWFGGITPRLQSRESGEFPGKFHEEAFTASAIDLPDDRGIPWRGVRLSCEAKNEHLVGLRTEIDYLTVGQSNVLKMIFRIINSTSAKRPVIAGWLVFVQPDGTSEKNLLRSERVERKATPWGAWSLAEHWGTVVNPDSGRTLALVSPFPLVRLIDWGSTGGHLSWMDEPLAPPEGVVERVCYMVLCDSPDQAKVYESLKEYR